MPLTFRVIVLWIGVISVCLAIGMIFAGLSAKKYDVELRQIVVANPINLNLDLTTLQFLYKRNQYTTKFTPYKTDLYVICRKYLNDADIINEAFEADTKDKDMTKQQMIELFLKTIVDVDLILKTENIPQKCQIPKKFSVKFKKIINIMSQLMSDQNTKKELFELAVDIGMMSFRSGEVYWIHLCLLVEKEGFSFDDPKYLSRQFNRHLRSWLSKEFGVQTIKTWNATKSTKLSQSMIQYISRYDSITEKFAEIAE